MTIPLDRPGATAADRKARADLVASATNLLPLLKGNSERSDRERRVPEDNIDALTTAGLLSILRPARHHGLQTDMRTCLEVSREVGRGCGSTAWSTTLLNVCAWYVGLFSDEAQTDVWGTDPETRVCGVLAPTGAARPVDGGFVVTGRWSPASGSAHAQWAIIGVAQDEGRGMILVPMADLSVEDTWFVAGMRGTASNTLVAQDIFVPRHRYLSAPDAFEGRYATPHTGEGLYRSPFMPVSALVLAGPQLGLAQAALDLVVDKAPHRTMTYTFYDNQAAAPTTQLAIAQAASLVDSAHLHAYRAAAEIDETAAEGSHPDYDARARMRMDSGVAAVHAREATRILISAHGAGSFAESNPLQRIWRDSETGSRHAVLNPEVSAEIYGKSLLGIRGTVSDLV